MGSRSVLIKLKSRARILVSGVGCLYSVYHTITGEALDFYCVGDGGSMEPTLSVGDIVLVRPIGTGYYLKELLEYFGLRGAIAYQDIKVGDVVVANHPVETRQRVIKRVVGLEGFKVPLQDKLVPLGRVWLEGDRSSDSLDSRHYGSVPRGLLIARVEGKLCPPPALFSRLPSSPVSTRTS